MSFKKGDQVKLAAVVPQGPVLKMRMEESGNIQCLLGWVDENGVAQERWFDASQLVLVD